MQLLYNIDPRDPLDRANRDQMREYAEKHGIKEIEWWMAGNQMRAILRKNGVKELGVPVREFGQPYGTTQSAPSVQVSSVDELERAQWEAQARDSRRETKPESGDISVMSRAELAKTCKARGIKMARTDSKEKLVERLSGKQNAA